MACFMHGREQSLTDIVLVNARGDTYVAKRKFRAEGMVSLVEAAALEVVADGPHHTISKIKLSGFRERTVQATIIGHRLLGDGVHQWQQFAPQPVEELSDRCRRHADIGEI